MYALLPKWKGEKNERIQHKEGVSSKDILQNYRREITHQNSLATNNIADHDFESGALFVRHMQSGHGKV